MDKKCREAEFENIDPPNKKAKRFPFWLVCSTCGRQGHKSKDCHSISYRGGEFIRTVDTYEDLDRIPRSSVEEIPSFENIEWRTFQKEELYEIPIDRAAVYEIAQKDESTEEIHVVYLGIRVFRNRGTPSNPVMSVFSRRIAVFCSFLKISNSQTGQKALLNFILCQSRFPHHQPFQKGSISFYFVLIFAKKCKFCLIPKWK
jgi:hypothetical protein